MKTPAEVVHAFSSVDKLSPGDNMRLLKINARFKDMASEVMDLVPECPDRTVALRKLLEAKFTCVQAITHANAKPVQAPKGGAAPTTKKAGTNDESED
jgi:hypothetical protein